MTLMCASVALVPPVINPDNTMSFVGLYTYSEFKNAPLMAGDFAVYFSNFPGQEPQGGSGNRWNSLNGSPSLPTYIAIKVLEADDIGATPVNPLPSYETKSCFIVYRGASELVYVKSASTASASGFTKDDDHCGLLIAAQWQPGVTYAPTTPAAWINRRLQKITWGGSSLTSLGLWDRLSPANDLYTDDDAFGFFSTGSGQRDADIFEFRT